MLNDITIAGRLVQTPELHQTNSGVSVCSFTVAVDRDYKQGDEKIADFITCSVWRGTAEFICKYGEKGRMVIVQGSMQSRKYTDKDGNNRTAWEIEARNVYFTDSKRDSSSAPDNGTGFSELPDADGDLPF